MTTKGQELKKELTQAFPGLKFSVKTKMVCKGSITEIAVTVKGLKDTNYIAEIKEITNKYHNWDWQTVTGDTNVIVNTDEETTNSPAVETVEVTKEETTNSPVVETVKEVKPKNKVAKLQAKLTRLNAQLRITKGRKNLRKLVEKILKVEAAIEQLEPIQEKPVKIKEIKQSKSVNTPVTKKDEFCKKPDKKTIKLLESRFKDAQIDITETQVILKSETSELKLNCSMELPELDYRRKDVIKSLIKQNQNPKIHSVYEYIGSILLAA